MTGETTDPTRSNDQSIPGLREAALQYARLGLRVFPLRPRTKLPATQHGYLEATTDAAQIDRWWTANPNANIGIANGDGLLVIDVDKGTAGEAALAELEAVHGSLPATRTAATGNGLHLYFRSSVPIHRKIALANHVDVLAEGGYVVAPPSVHPNGDTYSWLHDVSAAALPAAWEALLQAPATDRITLDDRPIPLGRQDDTLATMAWRMAGEGFPEAAIIAALREVPLEIDPSRAPFSDKDFRRWARSAVSKNDAGIVTAIGAAARADRVAKAGEDTGWSEIADVEPTTVKWLWRKRIPLGYVTILDGEPGNGKSLLSLDIAGRVSNGARMPDGTRGVEPAGVVIWTVEDGLRDVIQPRLTANGADLSRMGYRATAPDDKMLTFADFDLLRADVARKQAKLVIIDPMSAYLGRADSHRDAEIRGALMPVQRIAEELGVAILLIRHLNKSVGSSAINRGGGSIGIVGLARSGLIVAKESDAPDAFSVLARVKGNLSAAPESLRYRIEGEDDEQPRITWHGTSSKTANDLVAEPTEPASAVEEAMEWLRLHLTYGPVETKELFADGKREGHAEVTLKRAKQRLGVVSEKQGMVGKWFSRLPDLDPNSPERSTSHNTRSTSHGLRDDKIQTDVDPPRGNRISSGSVDPGQRQDPGQTKTRAPF